MIPRIRAMLGVNGGAGILTGRAMMEQQAGRLTAVFCLESIV
jgi:hypothetical protein